MAAKRTVEEKIIAATFKLALEKDWADVALADIAKKAKLPLGDVTALFSCKTAILIAYLRLVDARVMKEAEAEDMAGESARDRLFDVLMMRFDALSDDREALKRIALASRRDPVVAAALYRPMLRSLGWMLEAAGIDSSGLRGALRVRGLAAIWANVFNVWLDDGPDQSRTMAMLDRRLRQGEDLLSRVARFRRGGTSHEEATA
ncbi:MAG: TetR/AcrR family transcriptional regulator [Rhizobiales bacterium]|nr:TetR/AcrR family transcriptional regulator [Hyphomicrobiales bacterium]